MLPVYFSKRGILVLIIYLTGPAPELASCEEHTTRAVNGSIPLRLCRARIERQFRCELCCPIIIAFGSGIAPQAPRLT